MTAVLDRQRPSTTAARISRHSAFVTQSLSSRSQHVRLQAPLAATVPLPAYQEPYQEPSVPLSPRADGAAADPPVSPSSHALSELTHWLEEEEEELAAAEHRQRPFLPLAVQQGGAWGARETAVRAISVPTAHGIKTPGPRSHLM